MKAIKSRPAHGVSRETQISTLEARVASLTIAPGYGVSHWVETRASNALALASAKAELRAHLATKQELETARQGRLAKEARRRANVQASYVAGRTSLRLMLLAGKGVAKAAPKTAPAATLPATAVVRVTGKTARVADRRARHAARKAAKLVATAQA
jgi:hypothetical protein